MKSTILKCLALTIFLSSTLGCKKLLEPPTEPNSKVVVLGEVFIVGLGNLANQFGKGYDQYAEMFTQHLASNSGFADEVACYDLKHEYFDNEFDAMYEEVFRPLRTLLENGTDEGAWHYVGAAQVLTAMGLGKLTDTYGDLPWTEALQEDIIPFPKYDSQEDIYEEIQNLLSEAILNFNKTSDHSLIDTDPVFNGDIKKWKAIAYGLKARYYNHLSKRFPTQSAFDALTAIDKAKSEGIEAGWDMLWERNNLYSTNNWAEVATSSSLVGAEAFIRNLKQTNDPRLKIYFKEASTGTFEGQEIHCYSLNDGGEFSNINPDGFFTRDNSPTPLFSIFELLFIEAETAFRIGDLPRAATAYNEAVRNSITTLAIGSGNPNNHKVDQYFEDFASEESSSITLGKIMREKYKAMFTMGIENWVDLRRHNFRYPSYVEIPQDFNNQPISNDFIRRVLYPQSEINGNSVNTPDVGIFDRLWWDK